MKTSLWIIALLAAGMLSVSVVAEEEHVGCDHGHAEHENVEGGLDVPHELVEKLGMVVRQATGGEIRGETVFPAEIKLNRDRMAAVSARYASVVKAVKVEIGDSVQQGDVLLVLENRETLATYEMIAPLSGTIISKNVTAGETANEDRVLMEVADLSTVWADISVFPQYQYRIKKGMAVVFVAHDGHTARGAIKYISPFVSHETRTFTARCILAGADFTPGVFVRARIGTDAETVAVRVARSAVQTVNGEQVVFVPDGELFKARDVKTGHEGAGFIEIVSGLEAGEEYVAEGAFSLKAEMVTSGMDPHAGHGH